MIAYLSAGLSVLLLCSLPDSANAQTGLQASFTPEAGVTLTASRIGRAVQLESDHFLRFEEPGPALALGASLRVKRKGSPWAARLNILRSFSAGVTAQWECGGSGFCPSILIRVEGESSLTTATVGAQRFLPELSRFIPTLADSGLRPFVAGGVGASVYTLEWPAAGQWFSSGSDHVVGWSLYLGAGTEWKWHGISLVTEVKDQATWLTSSPASGINHDLALSLGVRVHVAGSERVGKQ